MLLHGEAVSIDMALSCELSYGRGLLSPQQRLRVLGVMRDLRLPLWHDSCSLDLLMKVSRPRYGLA
jgi:3-dehydroquinate synthase